MFDHIMKIKPFLGAALAGCLLLPGVSAQAQNAAPVVPPAPSGLSEDDPRALVLNYSLGPGDMIRIIVENHAPYSQDNVYVPPDGILHLPVFGEVRAAGRTISQMQQALRLVLKARLREPKVVVTLIKARPQAAQYISVLGAVNTPGLLRIRSGWKLTQVLASVGGVKGRLDEVQATLASKGRAPVKVDLQAAQAHPESKANVPIHEDDVLTVSPLELPRLVISGDVVRPGVYDLRRTPQAGAGAYELPLRPRLSDALLAAGLPQTPLANDAPFEFRGSILRRAPGFKAARKLPVNVRDALQVRDGEANLFLQPNDVLDIEAVRPDPLMKISVLGFVRNPGAFNLSPRSGVLQAIAEAGGLSQLPERIVTKVKRGAQVLPIDLPLLLQSPDPANDLRLQNNDVLLLNEPDIIRVQITGAVRTPDNYRLAPKTRLLDALAAAGGIRLNAAKTDIAVLRHAPNGRLLTLKSDAVALISRRELAQNVELHEGDTVSVVEVESNLRNVNIIGEIARPNMYQIEQGDSLVDLIARAGDARPTAALTRIAVTRNGKTLFVDAYDAIHNGTPLDFPLQQGDTVVIPRNEARVYILGAVRDSGEVPFPERGTLTVLAAISRAGSFAPNAKTQEVVLLRQGPNGKTVRDFLSLSGNGKEAAYGTPMRSGDVLLVPQTKATPGALSQARSVLGTVTQALVLGTRF